MKRLGILMIGCASLALLAPGGATGFTGVAQAEALAASATTPTAPAFTGGAVSLKAFIKMLAASDEQVVAQGFEALIAAEKLAAERALYEPEFYLKLEQSKEYTPTTAEQSLMRPEDYDQYGVPNPYRANDVSLRVGLAFREFTGAEIDLFYETVRLSNSLQTNAGGVSPEYTGSLGIKLTQPLLRKAGREVTEAQVKLATIETDIARETSRLTLAQRSFDGIRAYILVQRAKERVALRERTVALSEKLDAEVRNQRAAGLRSAADQAEASAALGLRRAQLAQARQELEEQIGAFQIFFTARKPGQGDGARWLPGDALVEPAARYLRSSVAADKKSAFGRRPEARVNALLIEVEKVNTMVAENQAKPELNLNLEYSRESLGADRLPLRQYLDGSNPFYSMRAGIEYRRGIAGDKRRQAELSAAKLRLQQAEVTRSASLRRIESELEGIGTILQRSTEQVRQQSGIVEEQRALLATEIARQGSGQSSTIEVLGREIDLIVAEEALADAVAQLNMSSFLASQVNGSLLARMGLE